MEPIRIVLADDHWLMRDETRRILEQYDGLQVVGEAEDGQQALELVESLRPNVAILDIRMPKLSGIEVVHRIRESTPETKVLILTAYDDDDYILTLMEAGVKGYLLKTARANELIDAVQAVHTGETVLHPAVSAKVASLWARQKDSLKQELAVNISPRELKVLELAAKGLRNKDIADKLNISVRTVEGHFGSIFTKFSVSSRVEAVLYALSQRIVTIDRGDSK